MSAKGAIRSIIREGARLHLRLLRSLAPKRTDLTIFVPTINAAGHIGPVLRHYRDVLRVPVRVFIDTKSADDTAGIARQFCDRVTPIINPSPIVEPAIEAMSKACGTTWVLRIDDDELPTKAMLDFVRYAIASNRADVYGFHRRQCVIAPDGQMLQWDHPDSLQHVQWRLYRVNKVKFTGKIHTPGFRLVSYRTETAPQDACLVHLDWAVRDLAERRRKLAVYESVEAGAGAIWRDWWLFEENSVERQPRFIPFEAPEFDALCQSLNASIKTRAAG